MMNSAARETSRTPRRLVVLVVLVVLAAAAAVALRVSRDHDDAQAVNRFDERALYVDPDSSAVAAATAAASSGDPAASTYEALAGVATGIWLTPEEHPIATVAAYVGSVVSDADDEGRVPVLVVYGIPQRDCSAGLSGGGLTGDQYLPWVRAIAGAAGAGKRTVVVLEPDALATAVGCGIVADRIPLLRGAVDALRDAGVTTYVDAGHSSWVDPTQMAAMLRQVGAETVRGFATNVSNFQSDADERAYADAISAQLDSAHYVVDSGRNGAGATGDWCNPKGRALGVRPGYVDDGSPLDAYLWIKPPGESDGSCGGGPPAGIFWPARAQELVAASGSVAGPPGS